MSDDGSTSPSGDDFEALLEPLLSPAYGYACHLAGDRGEAEDLLQEAALAAFRGFRSFRPGSNFKAWFYRILTNCFYARHRRRQRRPVTVELEDAPDLFLFQRTAELGLHGSDDDPARRLLRKLSQWQILAAFAALPADFRVVASLYFVDDLKYDEIADVLHLPLGTVRSRLHRGRKMLQKTLWNVAVEAGVASAPGAAGGVAP